MSTRKQVPVYPDHLGMIKSPDNWPCWPVLPLKRYTKVRPGAFPDLGIILSVEGVPANTVYEVDMFMCPDIKQLMTDPNIVKHEYSSPEEIVADGWVVD